MARTLRTTLLALAALCCAAWPVAAQFPSDVNRVFIPVGAAADCTAACKRRAGFSALTSGARAALHCAHNGARGAAWGWAIGTQRTNQGCSVLQATETSSTAVNLRSGFSCMCVRTGSATWKSPGRCPRTHDQRGACVITRLKNIVVPAYGVLIGSNCLIADRMRSAPIALHEATSGFQVLCLRKSIR